MRTVVEPGTKERETDILENRDAEKTHACPNCGAPAYPEQLMCLECGSRLALGYRRAPSWRLPAAIVGAVALLAALGVAIAFAVGKDDNTKTTAATPAQPAPQSAPADTPPTASQPTPAPQASTSATPAAPGDTATPAGGAAQSGTATTPAPSSPTSSGWPPGKSAFTVILASLPTEAAAQDKLAKAKAAGITGAALLRSDDFPTLRPGYWVVFDGQYDTTEQANAQAASDRGKGEFGDAYSRFVSKSQDAKP